MICYSPEFQGTDTQVPAPELHVIMFVKKPSLWSWTTHISLSSLDKLTFSNFTDFALLIWVFWLAFCCSSLLQLNIFPGQAALLWNCLKDEQEENEKAENSTNIPNLSMSLQPKQGLKKTLPAPYSVPASLKVLKMSHFHRDKYLKLKPFSDQ